MEDNTLKQSLVESLLDANQTGVVAQILEKMPAVEVAEVLADRDEEEIIRLLEKISPEIKGKIVSEFEIELQHKLFHSLDKKTFASIFAEMYSDVRADLYQNLNKEEQQQLLPYLKKKVREDVISLSAYPPETAGGIMNTDFTVVFENMTMMEAIAKVRKDAPTKKMIYYLYVVNEQMKMIGFITLKDAIMSEPDEKVETLVHRDFIYAEADEDRESVARKVEKYDLVAIPVLNPNGQLLGIVRHDDVIDVIRKEHTEDMEKFMGIVHTEDGQNYEDISAFEHFKRRVIWIVGLAAVGIISGIIIHRYEGALEQLIILALYMPMVADTGGNSGSQAATVVVRALALGQISPKNWLKILWKEARVGFLVALCLGIIAYGKVLFLSYETPIPEDLTLTVVAMVISGALSLQVISSTIIGAGLPILVKWAGGDPAVAASPAITTVVDITGLLIYFGVASLFLL